MKKSSLIRYYRAMSLLILASVATQPGRLLTPTAEARSVYYPAHRNILVLVADDCGVDQIPRYIEYYNSTATTNDDITVITNAANPAAETPAIDRLAAAGVTFLNAWSCPTCSPTRAGMFTGRYSFRHGVYDPTAPELPTGTWTIANVLKASGYETGLFGKWHLGEAPGYRPSDFGWDHHAGILGGELTDYFDWTKMTDWMPSTCTNYATYENVEDALSWIVSRKGRWMTTVAFNAPHTPMHVPPTGCHYTTRTPAAASGTNRANYRMMLECLDHSISDFLGSIPAPTLANTTIIFLGDNGTTAQVSDHFPTGRNKGSLYEGGITVPLIIADGDILLYGNSANATTGRVVAPGRIETNIVQTVDLFATIADIGGGDAACGVDSISMIPYLESSSASPQRNVIFAETKDSATGQWNVAVRGPSYKLIVNGYAGSSTTSNALYNLSCDRWEASELLATAPLPSFERSMASLLRTRLTDLLAVPLPTGCK